MNATASTTTEPSTSPSIWVLSIPLGATQVLPTSSVQRAVMAAGLGPSVRSPMAQALAEARALAPGAFPNPTHKVVVK